MDYTREDDRKLAEAMELEVIVYAPDSHHREYWIRNETPIENRDLPTYLSYPTPVSDYECFKWARQMSNVNSFVAELVTVWRDRNNANFGATDWNNEWLLYEIGDYARALYAVLRESE